MKKWLLFSLVIAVAVGTAAQDISGNWVSAPTRTGTLKNRTVDRGYEITINKKMKSLEGKMKSFFSWKSTYMGFNLFGKVDMAKQVLTLHTEHLSSSISGDRANMKDGNQYKWIYTVDSTKEYLTLVLNETDPHIILDSNIVFSRPRINNAYVVVPPVTVAMKQEDSLATAATVTQAVAERTNKLFKEIVADADSVKIDLYDVGEIDGDSVALFLNGKLIAEHQLLKASATTFNIVLDRNLPENRLVLFAENLGKVPPNTAYMVITINKKEYTLNMQSDEKTNGEIVFRFVAK